MKQFSMLALIIVVSNAVFAQERGKSIASPVISKKVYGTLTFAKGWHKNDNGQWDSGKNEIRLIDHFGSYELRKINYNDSTFYILIKKFKDGHFKYPAISQGWEATNDIYYYVFDSAQIGMLKNVKPNELQLIKIPVRRTSRVPLTYDAGQEMQTIMDDEPQNLNSAGAGQIYYLCINLQVQPDKNIARFLIFQSDSWDENYIEGTDSRFEYTATPDNLKTFYFETTLTNFQNLFKDLTVAQ